MLRYLMGLITVQQKKTKFKYSKLIVTLEQGVKYIKKLTIKTPVRRQSIFIFNFEHIQTLL